MSKKATKKRAAKKKTAKKKTARKSAGGRPKFQIDYQIVRGLAEIQCTVSEIASVLGCSTRTLERDEEFCRIHKRGLRDGARSLRRKQFELAMDGHPTMLVWLGKQYLGQKEKHEHSGDEERPLVSKIRHEVVK